MLGQQYLGDPFNTSQRWLGKITGLFLRQRNWYCEFLKSVGLVSGDVPTGSAFRPALVNLLLLNTTKLDRNQSDLGI